MAAGASMAKDAERTTREGVVAIIERAGRYLMIRRPDDIRAGGYWCFVGGGIDDGESHEQARVREVREGGGLGVGPRGRGGEGLWLYR